MAEREEPDDTPRRAQAARNAVGPAANVLAVLEMFAERKYVLLADVRGNLGVPTTTAYRLLATLEASGLVERVPRKGYRAGAKALRLAANLLANLDLRTIALPVMQRLATLPDEAVYLAVLREAGLVAVEILHPDNVRHAALEPLGDDMLVPMHAAALGRAVAVHLEPVQLAKLLGAEPYRRWTEHTPLTWQALSPRLDDVRQRGYAVARDEVTVGVAGVASAIFAGSQVVGSLSITGPTARLDEHRVGVASGIVLRAANKITHLLSVS